MNDATRSCGCLKSAQAGRSDGTSGVSEELSLSRSSQLNEAALSGRGDHARQTERSYGNGVISQCLSLRDRGVTNDACGRCSGVGGAEASLELNPVGAVAQKLIARNHANGSASWRGVGGASGSQQDCPNVATACSGKGATGENTSGDASGCGRYDIASRGIKGAGQELNAGGCSKSVNLILNQVALVCSEG